MITLKDLYSIMSAMAPLYFAMFLAYGSVKWWNIFTPEQCSGINRFVAAFAVPVLSFDVISRNNIYQMDLRFILADTMSKLLLLLVLLLSVWAFHGACSRASAGTDGGRGRGRRLEWLVTLFSIGSLNNTLVMGIPLLHAMYGEFTRSLMVQLIVLQCIIWMPVVLFLYEYRAAMILLADQFPRATAAAAMAKFDGADGNAIHLDGRERPMQSESEIDADGRVRFRFRKSASLPVKSDYSDVRSQRCLTLSASGKKIYSVDAPPPSPVPDQQPTMRASSFNEMDVVVGTPLSIRTPAAGGNQIWQQSPGGVKVVVGMKELAICGGGGREEDKVDNGGVINLSMAAKLVEYNKEEDEETGGGARGKEIMVPRGFVRLRLILSMVAKKLCQNPNTYASLLGLLWSIISFKWGIRMPTLVDGSIKIISDAGLGMAMFSMGLFMALQPRIIACGTKVATLTMIMRFIGGPILMSGASLALGLKGYRLRTAIVEAALPQGVVPFVFGREYGLHPDILSTGVIFGMIVSLPVTLLYYILLGI